MRKMIESFEFVEGVNFVNIDSLENSGTKYLLTFDDSCDKICTSKASVKFATAHGNHRLSTIYKKHNWFYQSKLERDVELQKTHIVLPKPTCAVELVRLVQNWDSNQSYMGDIEKEHLFPAEIFCLKCRDEQ